MLGAHAPTELKTIDRGRFNVEHEEIHTASRQAGQRRGALSRGGAGLGRPRSGASYPGCRQAAAPAPLGAVQPREPGPLLPRPSRLTVRAGYPLDWCVGPTWARFVVPRGCPHNQQTHRSVGVRVRDEDHRRPHEVHWRTTPGGSKRSTKRLTSWKRPRRRSGNTRNSMIFSRGSFRRDSDCCCWNWFCGTHC